MRDDVSLLHYAEGNVRRRAVRGALVIGAMVFSVFMPAHGQVSPSMTAQVRPNISAANYYYVSKPGELTMEVNVWGAVHSPGRYEVGTSTDLIQLLSYAGGPTADASFSDVRVIRIMQGGAGSEHRLEYTVDLDDPSGSSPAELMLRPGDTILIDTSGWVTTRDLLQVVIAAALVVTAVSQAVMATQ